MWKAVKSIPKSRYTKRGVLQEIVEQIAADEGRFYEVDRLPSQKNISSMQTGLKMASEKLGYNWAVFSRGDRCYVDKRPKAIREEK